MYINSLAIDSPAFNSTQEAYLYAIASQCPLQGGEAVFLAPSILSLVVDTVWLNNNCNNQNYFRVLNKTKSIDTLEVPNLFKARLYPNPTKDYTVLKWYTDANEMFSLTVTDVTGRLLFKHSMLSSEKSYTINTSAYSSGIYFVNLYNEKEERLFRTKMTVLSK